jgi:NO-binding membrane sensor protein with MHYT domain
MHIQGSPLVGFDFRLVALSGLALIVATYATLALAQRIKASQGRAWFAWLGVGASAMGIGIWSMHYLGLKALDLPVPMLNNPAVPLSILATIFASGITLLVVSGKSDSGRHGKAKSQRVSFDLAFLRTYAHSQMDITASRESLSRTYCWRRL